MPLFVYRPIKKLHSAPLNLCLDVYRFRHHSTDSHFPCLLKWNQSCPHFTVNTSDPLHPSGLPAPFWTPVSDPGRVWNKVFSWHVWSQVEITEKKSTCALARAPSEAPLLRRDCSSSPPLHTWKVSYAQVIKRLQAPARRPRLFFPRRVSKAGGVDTAGRIIRCAWIYNLE